MKRIGNLYHKVYDIKNLRIADKKARRGKKNQGGIKRHDRFREENIINLHYVLKNKEYITSEYRLFTIFDGKQRDIYRLPYYPDRITHHAIMNVLEPVFVSCFTKDTYSCIKGRGIHKALENLTKSLKDVEGTKHCLKLDMHKFYPSVKNEILKKLLRKKFKDKDLLCLLYNIIDSAQGVPIGNYLSQYFANFYLTYFDHWIKEGLKVKHYFRYCDDIVILSDSKEELHRILHEIIEYLEKNLELKLSNYQIFPVESRGIDFVGYRSFHKFILLRDGIKRRFIRMIKYNKNDKSIASYNGWLMHSNSFNLRNKYLNGYRIIRS